MRGGARRGVLCGTEAFFTGVGAGTKRRKRRGGGTVQSVHRERWPGELCCWKLAVCWTAIGGHHHNGVVGEPTAAQRGCIRRCRAPARPPNGGQTRRLARMFMPPPRGPARGGPVEHFRMRWGMEWVTVTRVSAAVAPYSDDVLQRGMVITLEPAFTAVVRRHAHRRQLLDYEAGCERSRSPRRSEGRTP